MILKNTAIDKKKYLKSYRKHKILYFNHIKSYLKTYIN
jgi:hypothetical protein